MPATKLGRKTILSLGAALAVLATVACGGDELASSSEDGDFGGASAGDSAALRDSTSQSAGVNKPAAPATGASTGGSGVIEQVNNATAALDRKIIFNAALDFEAEDVRVSFNDVARIARASGGFVEDSSLSERPGRDDEPVLHGTLSLRVPSTAYSDAVASLRGLGGLTLRKESSSANEVTDQYTDLSSRLRNLERSETQYLTLLGQAKTIQEILTVQERVDSVRLQIEQIQGRLKLLDDQTSLATIDVTLSPPAIVAVQEPKQEGPKSVKRAFVDAWDGSLEAGRYLAAAGAVLAVLVIWATPIAVVLGIVALVVRRRRPGVASTALEVGPSAP